MNQRKIEKMVDDSIKYPNFCNVMTEDLVEHGLNKGDTVFISGNQAVREDENDIYNLRLKMVVCAMDGDHVVTTQFFLVDPNVLKRVTKPRQERLFSILEDDFSEQAVMEEDNQEASAEQANEAVVN